MKKYFILVAFFLIFFNPCQGYTIDTLKGSWQVVVCAQGQECLYKFNTTLTFDIDHDKKQANTNVGLLNSIINHYQAFSEQYQYTSNSDGTYNLTKIGQQENEIPFKLTFFSDTIGYFYRQIPNGHYVRSELYGFLRVGNVNLNAFSELRKNILKEMPNFPTQATGVLLEKTHFQLSSSFSADILTGKQWYVQSQWQFWKDEVENLGRRNNITKQMLFESSFTSELAGNTTDNVCWRTMFIKNWTNPQIGLLSEYNFILINVFNGSKHSSSNYDPILYPNPVIQSDLRSIGIQGGVVYSDENTIIMVQSDKRYATLYTVNPLYNRVAQALFASYLVKVGINPIKGQLSSFNNTLCNPKNFTIKDLTNHQWVMVSQIRPKSDSKVATYGCINIAYTINGEQKTVIESLNGYDFESKSSFTKNTTFTYSDINSRNLYYQGKEVSLTFITRELLMLTVKSNSSDPNEDDIYLLASPVTKKYYGQSNYYALKQFYPDRKVDLLPSSSIQCKPSTKTVSNLTTHDLINNKWYELAMYKMGELPPLVSCAQWKFSKNKNFENYIDISSIASYKYITRVFISSNSFMVGQEGYLIPLITRMHSDSSNPNKTQMFISMLYYDGVNAIFLVDDNVDRNSGGDQFFFLSTKLEYTLKEQSLFEKTIEKIIGEFDEQHYFVVDNADCGFDDEEDKFKRNVDLGKMNFD